MPKCESWLADLIQREGGAITFAQFMGFALYDHTHGYYGAQVRQVGADGDFSTSATLCPAFGEAIARWAKARTAEDFPNGDFHLIEVGAGVGALAESVLKAWRKIGEPDVAYSAVETSPGLREALAPKAAELGFTVRDGIPDALAAAQGRAIIFSNELVDAFPARQLCWDGDDWREVGLRLVEGELVEGLLPFTDPVDADAPAKPRQGQRIFIHPSYHAWLQTELADWQRGRMLTIDYGAAYPAGEVRAYRNQDGIDGDEIYAHAGQQDLTCDVNFADLQRWGEQLGWQTISLLPQAGFLNQWIPDAETRAKLDPALAFLANPFGAGGAFQTLEQQRA
ncbi:SAM-dependent methyltransferase [Cerasicoccus frondis]|uniref:SAM-dependent methyltransferase n=1 Tax=Cerasicoccus frondis TaxID=490090 RepID=UPI00285295BC|nr:SAM-dependent methyltransferase [Cerasicoccus frondis]